jgi:hypothetical protein
MKVTPEDHHDFQDLRMAITEFEKLVGGEGREERQGEEGKFEKGQEVETE